MLEIRPHHLVCTAGYKGLNYNPKSAENWAKTITEIKNNPNIKLRITMDEDTLCRHCIHSASNNGTCDKNFVKQLDEKIKDLLKLKIGEKYSFNNLKNKLYSIMTPEKHQELCGNCGWWKKGLCHDTFVKS